MTHQLVRAINKVLKSGMYDYIDIETNSIEDKNVLISKNGGMVSLLNISGVAKLIGKKNFESIILNLYEGLSGTLRKPGFRLHFVFERNPEQALVEMKNNNANLLNTANTLNLNLKNIINERTQVTGEVLSSEQCVLAITTKPDVISSRAMKDEEKKKLESLKKYNIGKKPGEFSQSPHIESRSILEIHQGFYKAVKKALSATCIVKELDAYSAMRSIKMFTDPDMCNEDWRPILLGDKITPRFIKESNVKSDVSHIYNPSLSLQLFNREMSINSEDKSLIEIGNKIYAPLLVDIPPQTPMPFSDLFERIDESLPWRFSFAIDTGHEQIRGKVATKNSMATALSFFSRDNQLIRDAANELLHYVRTGEYLAMGSMSFVTWGCDKSEANKRKQMLAQAISTWGNLDVIEEKGDPIEALVNTVPGVSKNFISNPFPITLFDAFKMLPITRPASPWEKGNVVFKTIDNKAYPMELGSSKQTAWFDIFFAPPGMGKSFLLSTLSTALLTGSGYKAIPRIAIVDIGPSSSYFIELIKSVLPDNQKHLAQSYKLTMTKDWNVNIFDTPLGCEYPLAIDKEFVVNMLVLLLTPAGSKPVSRLPEICSKLINEMYDYYSEDNNPKTYDKNVEKDVDIALENLGMEISQEDSVSWYRVSKILFEKDLIREAELAHKYAVPTLSDATSVLNRSNNIKDVFSSAMNDGESTISLIESMLSSILEDYPILAGVSTFNIGSARICSMDVSEVAKGGSEQGKKKLNVMYMLSRNIMCRTFYQGEDTLTEIPEGFRDYHREIIKKNQLVPSKIWYDEFHRTNGAESVRLQVKQDVRESRKFNVHIGLLSQVLDDFDDDMISLANNKFILSKGNSEDTITKIIEKFNPSPDSINAMKAYCNGPGPDGSSMLYLGNLKGGKDVEMILFLYLGAMERWAYTTTKVDYLLKRVLVDEIGFSNAIKLLGNVFPSGSAADYIKSKSARIKKSDLVGSEDIYDYIKDDLISKHKDLIN